MVDFEYEELFELDSIRKEITISDDSNTIVITNSDLHESDFTLNESISTNENLKFGSCEAGSIEFSILNSFARLTGKWLTVSMVLYDRQGQASDPFTIGRYKVYSDKATGNHDFRSITAYDALFDVMRRSMDVWYASLWTNATTLTVKQIRDAFFTYVGVTQETTTLVNDGLILKKVRCTGLTGQDVIEAICEINGVFPNIGRDNVFHYLSLSDTETAPYEISNSLVQEVEYEDYVTATINKLTFMNKEGEPAVSVSSGTATKNEYIIDSNWLTSSVDGEGSTMIQRLQTAANNLYALISVVSYTPLSNASVKGNPCYEVGDKIKFTTKHGTVISFILDRQMNGCQSLMDNYSASGEEYYPEATNTLSSQINDVSNDVGYVEEEGGGGGEGGNKGFIIAAKCVPTVVTYTMIGS